MPKILSTDEEIPEARYSIYEIQYPQTESPFYCLSDSYTTSLRKLAEVFKETQPPD